MAAMSLWAATADAQSAAPATELEASSDAGLEQIIVTARRRAESMMDVPVSVSALSASDIERYSATDLRKIGELAPQVILAEAGSGSGASFTIRGVGSSWSDTGIQQAVAINIDGVQVGRGRIVRQGFFDLQQIELLKGPQALFFGKNSPAGVVSLTSKSPGTSFDMNVRTGYEFEADEQFIEAGVSVPLTSALRARLAVRYTEMDGFVDNVAPSRVAAYDPAITLPGALQGRQPGMEEKLGRLTLVFEPNESFDATLKITAGDLDRNTDNNAAQAVCAASVALPTASGVTDPSGDCKLDTRRSVTAMPAVFLADWRDARNGDPFAYQEALLGSLSMNFKGSSFTLNSTTGFMDLDYGGFEEFTYTSVSRIWGFNGEQNQQVSQELRLDTELDSPLNFTFGGYYEKSDLDVLVSAMLAYAGPDPATGRYYSYERFGSTTGDTYSLFGQLRWDITDALELAAGVRWTKEEKQLRRLGHSFNHPALAAGFVPVGSVFRGEFKDDNWSPEVTLSWHPVDDSLLYAALKTGYKSGGFSLPGNVSVAATLPSLMFDSETAEGAEVGYKAQFMGGALRFEATAYQYDFDDLQLSSLDAATTRFLVRNAAEARSRGVETTLNWRVMPELSLRGAAGYNRARYRSFPGAPCYAGQTAQQGCVASNPATPTVREQDLSGEPLPRAPEWSLSGGFTVDLPLSGGLSLGFSGDASFSDDYRVQENNNPTAHQDSFWLVNSSVRLYDDSRGWELALLGRNLTNEFYMVTSTDKPAGGPGQIAAALQRPREVMLQASWRFE